MGKMKVRSANPTAAEVDADDDETESPALSAPGTARTSNTARTALNASGTESVAPAAASSAPGTAASAPGTAAGGRPMPVLDEKARKAQAQALELAIGQVRKRCGNESIMRLGANYKANVQVIPTGVLSLDAALGVGGVPRGRIVEIFGPESSGKTTLTLYIVANAQRAGGSAAFIDAEHALDPNYARRLGVNLDTLLVSQPDSGEQALDIAEMLIASNALSVVVVDSVAALVPKAELEGEMGDSHVGLQARLMSQALRKLTAVVARSNTCLIFINQIREKIGVMFGSPETTTGGRALKFYSSVRLDIRRVTAIKEGDEVKGSHTRVKVVKNKVAPPFRQSEFDVLFDKGIFFSADLLDLAVEHGIVERSGTWHSWGETRIGQGRERAAQFLEENPDLMRKLEFQVRTKLGILAGMIEG